MNSTECNEIEANGVRENASLALVFWTIGIPFGLCIIATNAALVVAMTSHKTNATRRSTQIILVSDCHCAILAGLILVGHSAAFPHLPVFHSTLKWLCHIWAAFHLTLVTLDCLHIGLLCLDQNYVVISVGCSVSTRRVATAVLVIWLHALFISFLVLAFDRLPYDKSHHPSCDPLSLNRYYCLVLLIHVIAGAICNLFVVVNLRRTLDHHQRQIQVTNTITYKNLLREIKLAQTGLIVYGIIVAAWLPFIVAEFLTFTGMMPQFRTLLVIRLTYLVGYVSYLKPFVYVVSDLEIRRDFVRVVTCKLPVEKNQSLSSSSRW